MYYKYLFVAEDSYYGFDWVAKEIFYVELPPTDGGWLYKSKQGFESVQEAQQLVSVWQNRDLYDLISGEKD